jgi:hypothetical protein
VEHFKSQGREILLVGDLNITFRDKDTHPRFRMINICDVLNPNIVTTTSVSTSSSLSSTENTLDDVETEIASMNEELKESEYSDASESLSANIPSTPVTTASAEPNTEGSDNPRPSQALNNTEPCTSQQMTESDTAETSSKIAADVADASEDSSRQSQAIEKFEITYMPTPPITNPLVSSLLSRHLCSIWPAVRELLKSAEVRQTKLKSSVRRVSDRWRIHVVAKVEHFSQLSVPFSLSQLLQRCNWCNLCYYYDYYLIRKVECR